MERSPLPSTIRDDAHLEDLLGDPSDAAMRALGRLDGDIIILGVAGKMGPSLARMAKRASVQSGKQRRVIGVSRFSGAAGDALQGQLHAWEIETIRCDLLDQRQLDNLPRIQHVIYMAGMKFGSTGQEALTWAMNAYLPGMVCHKFRDSRIAAFSTGNIYGLSPLSRGGSIEADPLNPAGDYAMSCLGRERMFEHFSRALKIPITMIRLNYATEMRYGILVDIARKVWTNQPVDVSMGALNAIWQADANAMALASLDHAATPPFLLNVAGPEQLSVRTVAEEFGRLMNKPVRFTGAEAGDALLSNGRRGHDLYGYPRVSAQVMLRWIADWVSRGGSSLNKPTHFETRDGKF